MDAINQVRSQSVVSGAQHLVDELSCLCMDGQGDGGGPWPWDRLAREKRGERATGR